MIQPSIQLDTRQVVRALRRLPERLNKITAQELNRQRQQSRTLMVRGLVRALNVKPQKRLRRRIVLPRGGRATPRKLVATGLSLVESMPARWFARGKRGRGGGFALDLPSGTRVIQNRPMDGAPFKATMRSGFENVFRRAGKASLPIIALNVDTTRPGYAVRQATLLELARRFPEQYQRRVRRELRRTFRA